jgi:hypothetical protein
MTMLELISPNGTHTEIAVEDLQAFIQHFGPLPDGWTTQKAQQNAE